MKRLALVVLTVATAALGRLARAVGQHGDEHRLQGRRRPGGGAVPARVQDEEVTSAARHRECAGHVRSTHGWV
jgi:hypothetical protein